MKSVYPTTEIGSRCLFLSVHTSPDGFTMGHASGNKSGNRSLCGRGVRTTFRRKCLSHVSSSFSRNLTVKTPSRTFCLPSSSKVPFPFLLSFPYRSERFHFDRHRLSRKFWRSLEPSACEERGPSSGSRFTVTPLTFREEVPVSGHVFRTLLKLFRERRSPFIDTLALFCLLRTHLLKNWIWGIRSDLPVLIRDPPDTCWT